MKENQWILLILVWHPYKSHRHVHTAGVLGQFYCMVVQTKIDEIIVKLYFALQYIKIQ